MTKKDNFSTRLNQLMLENGLRQVDVIRKTQPLERKYNTKIDKGSLSQYLNDISTPNPLKLSLIAEALNVNERWLIGVSDQKERIDFSKLKGDNISYIGEVTDVITLPIIATVKAGYGGMADIEYSGETISLSREFFRGKAEDYLVINITGNSMYPRYLEGDKVIIHKQPSVESGAIALVVYQNEATIKRVIYKQGEDWLRLEAFNPTYPPITIKDSYLELCLIVGEARMMIRREA